MRTVAWTILLIVSSLLSAPAALAADSPKSAADKSAAEKSAAEKEADAAAAKLLAGVQAPVGFRVSLFASPPQVGYPTCLATSPSGEVYVAVDENGSLGRNPGRRQQVMRCVDKDGDGRADEFTVFADHVGDIRGMFYDHNTLWVLSPPLLRAFHDDNGDGVADRNEILLEGLGTPALKQRGADHCTNGFRLAIDGWIYIAIGDFGFTEAKGRDGRTLKLNAGGVLRTRPDGTEMEVYAFGLRNIFDVSVDPCLNVFTRDNTNDGGGWNSRLSHIIQTGNYGYPRLFVNFNDEIVQPLADYGGGSATGSLFLDEPNLPEGYSPALYTCDWGRNEVYRHRPEPNGAGFRADQQSFVKVPAPTDIDVDGQGRLFIASWRGGGFDFKGPNVGMVLRVSTPNNEKALAPVDLQKASPAELVQRLSSESQFWRVYAQREILRRGVDGRGVDAGLVASLEQVAAGNKPLSARVAAIFTLKQLLGAKSHSFLGTLVKDDKVREFALRALADRKTQLSDVPRDSFIAALSDANPRVRLSAVVGLSRLGAGEAAERIVPLSADADPLVAHVAITALADLEASQACLKAIDTAPPVVAVGAARALQRMHTTATVDGLIARLGTVSDAAVQHAIVRALCRLYHREGDWNGDWWGTRPDTRGPYYRPVTWEQSEKIVAALQSAGKQGQPAMLDALRAEVGRHRVVLPGLKLESAESQKLAALLDAAHPPREAIDTLFAAASGAKNPPELRARALDALCRAAPEEKPTKAVTVLLGWHAKGIPPSVLTAARQRFLRDPAHAAQVKYFMELAESRKGPERELGLAVLLSLATDPQAGPEAAAEARQALEGAWIKPDSAASLLSAMAELGAAPDLKPLALRLLDKRDDLRRAAEQAAAAVGIDKNGAPLPRLAGKSYEVILADVVKEPGDVMLGSRLFVRQGCVKCHTVSSSQAPIGPFLGGISKRYSPADLVQSVVQPSAKIAQGFVTQTFVTKEGKQFAGFVIEETADDVQIRDTQGQVLRIAKNNIDERGTSQISMMPEGLAVDLTARQLASLISYLASLPDK